MIRWYDYIAALIMAEVLLTIFFTVPFFGAIIAYVLYEYVWDLYCNFRLEQEYGK
jgi:TRAP-type mannitol/chloroaromatic compound transport system permease small subunit